MVFRIVVSMYNNPGPIGFWPGKVALTITNVFLLLLKISVIWFAGKRAFGALSRSSQFVKMNDIVKIYPQKCASRPYCMTLRKAENRFFV